MQAAKLQLSTRILTRFFELKEEVPFFIQRGGGHGSIADVTMNIIICFFKVGKR